MKLLSLNIWGGKIHDPLINFIKKYSQDVDIFCFQEVFKSPLRGYISREIYADIYSDLEDILKGYNVFFKPVQDGFDIKGPVDFEITQGQATFVKDTIKVDSHEQVFLCGARNNAVPDNKNSIPAAMLCTRISLGRKKYTICNVHGFSYPGEKLDTEERIKQSQKILNFLKREKGSEIILCGDFNLMPETKSIKMIEEQLENLIKKFNIENTRSNLSYYANTPDAQKFADYTFVGPKIKVDDFKVLPNEVSDHLAMYLDFDTN